GGALAVMQPKLKVMILFVPRPIPLWAVVAFAFFFGFVIDFFFPSIAWEAHLGGLLVGAAFGFYFRRKQQRIIFIR
ncbi:rhomboid family intramembrane serine protease, partial [Chloroflexota bacterium]